MKSKILNMLKAHENTFLSGAEISEALSISRQAVSKHIKKLKEEGHAIESVSRKGHRYVSGEEIYNQTELLSENSARVIGKKLIFLESIDSTNDYMKKIAMESPHGTVVISDEQTSGKGRLGRQWASEKGTGIWISVLLKPDIEPSEAPKITQIAAAALTKALNDLGLAVQIKWPNDLIIGKRKVSGTLTEMSAELGGINYVIVGTGLNVNQSTFPEDLTDKATSIYLETGQKASRKEIVLLFLKTFEDLYDDFVDSGSLQKTVAICKAQSVLMNRHVRLITKSKTREVKVIDINEDGQLVVENEQGLLENVFYGEVSVRGLYEYVD